MTATLEGLQTGTLDAFHRKFSSGGTTKSCGKSIWREATNTITDMQEMAAEEIATVRHHLPLPVVTAATATSSDLESARGALLWGVQFPFLCSPNAPRRLAKWVT